MCESKWARKHLTNEGDGSWEAAAVLTITGGLSKKGIGKHTS